MIDREKVIKGLECCTDQRKSCTDCPYYSDEEICTAVFPMMEDALVLLKSDQTYLQKLTERLQNIADIAIRGLPEVKDD